MGEDKNRAEASFKEGNTQNSTLASRLLTALVPTCSDPQ